MPRTCPPQSAGLPPSNVYHDRSKNHSRDRFRRRHPARKGRPTNAERDALVRTIIGAMDKKSPEAIAVLVKRDVCIVRFVIRAAREAFARHAEDYVELHWHGAVVAASKGDAGPAAWALERIQADGKRVIDLPSTTRNVR